MNSHKLNVTISYTQNFDPSDEKGISNIEEAKGRRTYLPSVLVNDTIGSPSINILLGIVRTDQGR